MEPKYSKNFYRFCRVMIGGAMKVVYPKEVIGYENIPLEGPFILAGNHKSLLDIPLVAIASKRDIHYIAKEELFHNKIAEYLLKKMGAIPINRKKVDLTAMKKAIKVLQDEQILGIFPEGTRHKGEGIGSFKSGAATLAVKGNCPIIPFGISGEYKIGQKITIRFGDAITFNRNDLKEGKADLKLEEAVKTLIKK